MPVTTGAARAPPLLDAAVKFPERVRSAAGGAAACARWGEGFRGPLEGRGGVAPVMSVTGDCGNGSGAGRVGFDGRSRV